MPSPLSNSGAGLRGFQEVYTAGSEFNALAFIIQMLINKVATATLVKVLSVTNSGGIEPVGFVDILPLVNQIDGAGNSEKHTTIFKCPYFRLQGGGDAVILDPKVGDLGIAIFADHDISSVTANKDQANPGSRRRYSMADALYLGGVLNGTPTQFVQFSAAGIRMHSPVMLTLTAPNILLQADSVIVNGGISFEVDAPAISLTGAVAVVGSFTVNGVDVGSTHKHSGVSTGIGNTGNPI